jgi:hypothetical protein
MSGTSEVLQLVLLSCRPALCNAQVGRGGPRADLCLDRKSFGHSRAIVIEEPCVEPGVEFYYRIRAQCCDVYAAIVVGLDGHATLDVHKFGEHRSLRRHPDVVRNLAPEEDVGLIPGDGNLAMFTRAGLGVLLLVRVSIAQV